ncbi:MAG: TonB-dependent receptor [Dysgonamonadaceae bacterium]|nr:TonB-dependent receptor [Dysgonamonadaceae bacterium]
MRKITVFLYGIFFFLSTLAFSQNGTIKGKIINAKTNEPIEFAGIQIQGTTQGTTSEEDGVFEFTNVTPGFVRLVVSFVGFETTVSPEIQVQGNQTSFVDIALPESSFQLQEISVRPNYNMKRIESPISVISVGVRDIEKGAGVNRDVSKVIQTLPGVGATDPNRNDLIVRGGGPSENVFYLDGIEIPIINHFATQGSSGGVVGVINPDFVQEISFYTGAFPANRTNALSSVMEIRQKDGSQDRVHTKLSIGASDAAVTVDGPINDKSSFIVSARQSYLQLLFKLIGLPFLPTYNDFQAKYKLKIDNKNELTFIGIGAIDDLVLNTDLQTSGTESQKYLLSYLPVYKQWNYTVGAVYKHFGNRFIDSWVLSRSMLRNTNFKYRDNDESNEKMSDYLSDEAVNKLRFEREYPYMAMKLKVGAGVNYAHYTNNSFRSIYRNGTEELLKYDTDLILYGYQAFAQLSDDFIDKRLKLSLGVSVVGNNFNNNMKNPLNQLSPRLSASFEVSDKWDINANVGRYASQPAYTTMGYKKDGEFINKNEQLKYITSNQAIAGFEYRPTDNMRLSVEGFYKQYDRYPFSIDDGISIASKGTEYGQVGDEEITSIGKGKAYGVEVFYKIMDWNRLNLTTTYTFFRSEFTDKDNVYRPSSWDTRHMVNLIGSYKLNKGWNVSARWRFSGGAPYTPIDEELSTNREAWNITNQYYLDYDKFNTLRLSSNHSLDLRVDKEIYFKKWVLNFYTDVQNAYNYQSESPPIYTNKDVNGNVLEDPSGDPTKQGLRVLDNMSGTVLPTIGVIVKF